MFVDGIEKYQWPVSTGLRGEPNAFGELHGVVHEQVSGTASSGTTLPCRTQSSSPRMGTPSMAAKRRRSSAAPLLMAACALHQKMPRRSSIWSRQTAWRIPRWSLPASRLEGRGKGGGSTQSTLSRRRCGSLGLLSTTTWSLRLAAGPGLESWIRASATLSRAAQGLVPTPPRVLLGLTLTSGERIVMAGRRS